MIAAHRVGDALAVVAEDVLRRPAADRLAHGAFADLAHHLVGIGDVEQIGFRIGDLVGDRELARRRCSGRPKASGRTMCCRALRRDRSAFRRCWPSRQSRSATNGNAGPARKAPPSACRTAVRRRVRPAGPCRSPGTARARPAPRPIRPNSAGLAPPPPGSACFSRSWPRRMMSSRSGGEPCGPLGPRGPWPHGPPLLPPPPHGPPPPLLSFQGMNVLSVFF